jgi:hypothetical protein
MIAVDNQLTAGTMIHTLRDGHALPLPTPAVGLACIGRIDFHELPASFFRLAGLVVEEFRPSRVMNAPRKEMVMDHAIDVDIFHCDHSEPINRLMGILE